MVLPAIMWDANKRREAIGSNDDKKMERVITSGKKRKGKDGINLWKVKEKWRTKKSKPKEGTRGERNKVNI